MRENEIGGRPEPLADLFYAAARWIAKRVQEELGSQWEVLWVGPQDAWHWVDAPVSWRSLDASRCLRRLRLMCECWRSQGAKLVGRSLCTIAPIERAAVRRTFRTPPGSGVIGTASSPFSAHRSDAANHERFAGRCQAGGELKIAPSDWERSGVVIGSSSTIFPSARW